MGDEELVVCLFGTFGEIYLVVYNGGTRLQTPKHVTLGCSGSFHTIRESPVPEVCNVSVVLILNHEGNARSGVVKDVKIRLADIGQISHAYSV